jgi:hypothetical protein
MEEVKDLVCGMMIDPKTAAATSEYEGKTSAILILEAENLRCLTNDGIDANVPGVSQS